MQFILSVVEGSHTCTFHLDNGDGSSGGYGDPPGGGTPGWEPWVTPDCDSYILDLQKNLTFADKFKALNSPALTGLDYEKGLYVADKDNTYHELSSNPSSPKIYVSSSTPLDGFIHSHYAGTNSIFSPDDLIYMARLFLSGLAKDPNNLFFGMTSSYGDPYLMKVTDQAIFREFATKIVGMAGDEKALKKFYNRYNYKLVSTDPLKNEVEFLKMLKDLNVSSGLSLYKGNADCNQWAKLTLSNFGVDEKTCN